MEDLGDVRYLEEGVVDAPQEDAQVAVDCLAVVNRLATFQFHAGFLFDDIRRHHACPRPLPSTG